MVLSSKRTPIALWNDCPVLVRYRRQIAASQDRHSIQVPDVVVSRRCVAPQNVRLAVIVEVRYPDNFQFWSATVGKLPPPRTVTPSRYQT